MTETIMKRIKCYSDLSRIDSFLERYKYLRIGGTVGHATFGFDRHINQSFYMSREWKSIRDAVVVRDNGCDLGVVGHEIHSELIVHHMTPMTPEDIIHGEEWILDPEYLITTCHETHNAIHYGDVSLLRREYTPRKPGDTILWPKIRR